MVNTVGTGTKTTPASSSPGITSPSPISARNPSDAAGVAAGGPGGDVATPPVAVVRGGVTGESSQCGSGSDGSGGGDGGGAPSYYGGVSYVKLTAPVSVPLELNLEKFCTEFTGNAPPAQGLDLGEAVDSLDGLAGIPSVSAAPLPAADGATSRSGRSATAVAAAAAAAGDEKSSSDRISVDLSMREGWLSGGGLTGGTGTKSGAVERESESGNGNDPFRFPSPLGKAREGEEGGVGSEARGRAWAGAGVKAANKLGNVFRDSTNSSNGGTGSGGVRETATERRKRQQKVT